MKLSALPNKLAVCRLNLADAVPRWATESSFYSISKTAEELSIVCNEENVPEDVKAEKNWRAFKVQGPLDFGLTGILASIANPLAETKISIFAISTFDTDYILVKAIDFDRACKCLESANFKIEKQ